MLINNDESYENFNYNDINNLRNFNYKFSLEERFIHVKDTNNNYFSCQTPFLKILKPIHVTLNKKKTIAKKYLILELNDELDFNNQIGEFIFIINKIHEISQEKIKEKSLEWFNTEFDEIGLDIKVRRPIDQQKDNEFIKISIPTIIEEEINKLSKGNYVLCNIIFKGLKISNDYINEEWEITNLITQEKYDEEQNAELIYNNDNIQLLLENNILDENILQENIEENIQENILEENILEENILEENILEENILKENILEENIKKNKKIKNKKIKKDDNAKKDDEINFNKDKKFIKKINKKIFFN